MEVVRSSAAGVEGPFLEMMSLYDTGEPFTKNVSLSNIFKQS